MKIGKTIIPLCLIEILKPMNRNKIFGLLLAAACFAGGELEMQGQWGDDKIGVEITLVTGEKKIRRFDKNDPSLGGTSEDWEYYNENYFSIVIPEGFTDLYSIYIPIYIPPQNRDVFHSSLRRKDMETIRHVSLPNNASNLGDVVIIGTSIRSIKIPSGLKNLRSFDLRNNPLETIQFPSGNAGRLVSLYSLYLQNTNIETLSLPEGMIKLGIIDVQNCSRLHTIVFGKDTKEDVFVIAGGSGLKRIVIPRRLERKVSVFDEEPSGFGGKRGDWNHLEILYLEDLNPQVEVTRKQGVLEVRWNSGSLYASEQPDGHDWRLVGGVELSPLRIPAVLENKMFFQVKPQE